LDVCKTPGTYRQEFTQAGYDPYDLAMHLCLQKLVTIEFGTRLVGRHMGGIGFLRYVSKVTDKMAIQEMGKNRITITTFNRGKCFAPGHEIGVGHKEHDPNYVHRTITKVEMHPTNPEWVNIYYAGEDLQGVVEPETDAAFGIPQKNGLSDTISYHTGRGDLHSLEPNLDYLLNSFRYRGIENPWGNMWEHLEGLRIHRLHYSYTFDPELYEKNTEQWNEVSYCAPCQPCLGSKITNLWIDSMGYDPKEPLLVLPQHSVGNDKLVDNFYGGGIFTYLDRNYADEPVDPDIEYRFTVGAGFDARTLNSPFTYRGFIRENTANWLYTSRLCLRK